MGQIEKAIGLGGIFTELAPRWYPPGFCLSVCMSLSLLKTLLCKMGQLSWKGCVAVAFGFSDRWQVTGDTWHVTCDTCHLAQYYLLLFLYFSYIFYFLVSVLLFAHVDIFTVSHILFDHKKGIFNGQLLVKVLLLIYLNEKRPYTRLTCLWPSP